MNQATNRAVNNQVDGFPLSQLDSIVNHAVSETFQSFFNVPVNLKEKSPVTSKKLLTYDISGNIGFVDRNNQLKASLTIACSHETLLAIVRKFYQDSAINLNDRKFTDAIGEITNVVHGLIRKLLSEKGYEYSMCLPVVVIGNHHCVFDVLVDKQIHFTFETSHGPLTITFNFSAKKQ